MVSHFITVLSELSVVAMKAMLFMTGSRPTEFVVQETHENESQSISDLLTDQSNTTVTGFIGSSITETLVPLYRALLNPMVLPVAKVLSELAEYMVRIANYA